MEVSTFPIVIIFFRGCVPEMFVTSHSVTYCIYVPGKSGICFHHYCAVNDECKYSDTFWLVDRTRLFVQYTISSSLCKLIWRHWTYKMPVRYILSNVWVRLSIFSPLSIIQCVGLYVISLPISVVMIEKIYILCLIIIIKSEVWTITHCLGLGYETMVSAVCLSTFLWICGMAGLLRGTFVSWWYLPRIWPSVTDMQYHYHARYPTDDWHLAYIFRWYIFPSKCVCKACFPILLTHGEIPAQVLWPPQTGFPPHEKTNKTEQGGPSSPLEPSDGAFELTHGSAYIIGWYSGLAVWFPPLLCSLWGVS